MTATPANLPDIDAFTRPYWDAAAEGRLLLRRCAACERPHHYPREFCPHCWSEDVRWEPASGRATLYTWSVVHRNDLPPFGERVPYVAAVVDLAEGPRMMTEVVGVPEGDLRIGMELEVAFRPEGPEGSEGPEGPDGQVTVPVFGPPRRPGAPRSPGSQG
ncbi:Zn-ribbon domain-containing OB-fold protein [Streptomyces wedmorensis]|uniref:Zn-ribbon domain-containing OB-fold protein n=1 Tax=Streptomyces wedmorensis TaxID=43759 RepID=UPI00341C1D29